MSGNLKKIFVPFIVLLLNTLVCNAQKLIITEVDAAKNSYFDKASMQTLGKVVNLNMSGNTLAVKIGSEPELVLNKLSDKYFETESKTKDGIVKFSIKLITSNSVITTAELTGTIIPADQSQKKVWWTVTARQSDIVSAM
jgi:hypothetical protein